ncbi:MAG: four helix bundle protein [Endomicrobia bacterium]|nr:four helix bundle protein [Endomicrobiia bacterium]
MTKENTAKYKSRKFAIKIVELYKSLNSVQKEFILSKQLVKSATSIGANLAESEYAVSKNDFLSKIYIALKEAAETLYWLELLFETNYIDNNTYLSLKKESEEILKILKATTKTLSKNNRLSL